MSRIKKAGYVASILTIALSIMILALLSNLQASQKENNVNEKVRQVLKIFKQMCLIPRCPDHEKGISKWLKKWAKSNGLKVKSDQKGNLFIKVPASKGFENVPVPVLQGHLDMISIGPTIVDAHSPDEKLYISSVEKVWKLLAAILASYGE